MAGPVFFVTFLAKTYLVSKADFDRRPNQEKTGDFQVNLPLDAKLVPIAGGTSYGRRTDGKLSECALLLSDAL